MIRIDLIRVFEIDWEFGESRCGAEHGWRKESHNLISSLKETTHCIVYNMLWGDSFKVFYVGGLYRGQQ